MDEAYRLLDPPAARTFLYGFSTAVKKQGEAWFRGGRVHDLVPRQPGRAYAATVEDGLSHEVHLSYSEAAGWQGFCSCAERMNCGHVFAAMNALLAEDRSATVRGLSSGAAKPELGGPEDLVGRLTAALGRPLQPKEKRFVGTLHTVYGRSRQRRQLAQGDLQLLGLPVYDRGWDGPQLWPVFPENEYEFWLYLANALQERGLPIPEVMAPITDLSVLEPKLVLWRRQREVKEWQRVLANLQLPEGPAPALGQEPFDLRLVIHPHEARLELRRPGQSAFEPLKQHDLARFGASEEEDSSLGPEAQLLWHLLSQSFYGLRVRFGFDEPGAAGLLRQVLRLPILESRIVNAQGQPLARPAEPLRWELTPAANPEDDYRLQLVQADGTPVPPVLATLPGHPALFLTGQAIFSGPESPTHLIQAGRENRIPAPALEQARGVSLLQALGVELPPRLRERVRTLAYHVTITAELRSLPYTDAEECHFTVSAKAPDGSQQDWRGGYWYGSDDRRPRRKPGLGQQQPLDNTIVVYDSSALVQADALLEPLRLKPSYYGTSSTLRVTRKFPETFAAWLKNLPPEITVELKGELASFNAGDVAGRVRLDVAEADIDWFDLRVVLDVQDTTLSPAELKLLLNAKGRYVRLEGKGWRRLHYELSEEENERLARLGLSPRELSAEPQRLHALQLADPAAKKFLPQPQFEQVQRRAEELKARVAPALPGGVTAQLRPYQLEGYHFLAYLSANRFGGILADDMGLGKTLQTLAWLLWLREQAPSTCVSQGGTSRAENDVESSAIASPSPPLEERAGERRPTPETAPRSSTQAARRTSAVGWSAEDKNLLSPALSSRGGEGETAAPEDEQSAACLEQPPAWPPSLVVCPKSVTDNWHAEARRFTPGLRVRVWSSAELEAFTQELQSADLHVLNYSQLRTLAESLAPVRWLAVILDEGQYIKNPTSQTAQVARSLRAGHRLVLTGTPIENRLLDLWSLLAFAMPGVLGNRNQFAKLYNAKDDPFARRRLSARVRPFLLRRTKAQVAPDLPERIEEDLFCEIEGEQKDLYRAELKRAQQLLLGISTQKELAQQQFHLLTSMLRLRQICCHPRLLKPDSAASSAKLEALLEQLEPLMEEGQKVLVFSQFVELLDILKAPLQERGWPLFYLAGQTENRGELVRKFQQCEGPAVFLISLKAGGFGLNLTAASYVVLFDPWWNPAVEAQAIDRTHRIGQANKIIAYRLLIKDSIEGKIRELQKQKKALAEDVLGEAKFSQSLTLEDLRFLFSD